MWDLFELLNYAASIEKKFEEGSPDENFYAIVLTVVIAIIGGGYIYTHS